jgi:hypothetical protein
MCVERWAWKTGTEQNYVDVGSAQDKQKLYANLLPSYRITNHIAKPQSANANSG